MRASRLVSLLLLLQARGRMTAPALASELEVSVRTIYRDVEALGAAGVPIYAQPGPTGGIQLVDGYRTRLTGLTEREADSLFLSGAPGAVAQLGLGTVLAAAELKVLAALPRELRSRAARVRERFHLDAPGWFSRPEEVPMLATLAEAVWDDRRIELRYARWDYPPSGAGSAGAGDTRSSGAGAGGAGAGGGGAGGAGAGGGGAGGAGAGAGRGLMADPVAEVRRSLDPLGLVLKGGVWYLVARHRTSIRTYRVSRCRAVQVLTSRFERPERFVLADHWAASQREFEQAILHYTIDARLSPAAIRRLPAVAPGGPARLALASAGEPEADGWVRVALPAEGFGHATVEVMSLAPDIQVLGPPDLLRWVAAASAKMAARHPEPVAGLRERNQ